MRVHRVLVVLGTAALLLGACGRGGDEATQQAVETVQEAADDVAEAAAETAEDAIAAVEEVVAGIGAGPACVAPKPANSICTMDINACGFSSGCACDDGYAYNAALGQCLLILEGVGAATPVSVADSDCAKPSAGICTRDINACGQPSSCRCDDGFAWNDVAGKCLKVL